MEKKNVIHIRINDATLHDLEHEAMIEGVPLSTWVRILLNRHCYQLRKRQK